MEGQWGRYRTELQKNASHYLWLAKAKAMAMP